MLNLKLCVFIRELLSPRSAARMCGEIMATEWDDLSQIHIATELCLI